MTFKSHLKKVNIVLVLALLAALLLPVMAFVSGQINALSALFQSHSAESAQLNHSPAIEVVDDDPGGGGGGCC